MTQLCHPLQPHDSLSRDHQLHLADSETSPALKIVLGTLLGLLLALAGIFSGPPQSVDRFAPPEEQGFPQAAERPLRSEGIGRIILPGEAPPAVVIEGR
jgi:hypothetical protein